MLDYFQANPGLYFVVATLLPLASFALLFLAYGVWAAVRPFRDTRWGEPIYNLFGGDGPGGKVAAYLATGAIGLACVFSLTGFSTYYFDHHRYEHAKKHAPQRQEEIEELKKRIADKDSQLAKADAKTKEELTKAREALVKQKEHEDAEEAQMTTFEGRWTARLTWLRLVPLGIRDPEKGTTLQLGYAIDSLAGLMFVMVTVVATLIHLFSIGYMSDELAPTVEDHQVHTEHGHLSRRGRFGRFFMFLSLFCFSMLNLVLADNLFQVFVSWELVGICSYLLIGFYFERQSASNAANKAFITNRVGDAGFIVGLLILWTQVGTFNFQDLFRQIREPLVNNKGEYLRLPQSAQIVRVNDQNQLDDKGNNVLLFPREVGEDFKGPQASQTIPTKENPKANEYGSMPYWMLVLAGLGVFLGCVGKSAQFPLQVWLPDAMEGPTPVSALIHAATMVAAGVYLVGRCFPLFTPEALLAIAYVGAITLFIAASIATVMTDIKKVLAYSTVSQLGFMMLALGVGGWVAGLFHLITHACFKALLFLGSGSVIHGCHHEQDMLKMGGLYPKMRTTALTMLVGVLAISGVPFFSGWYSKDGMLTACYGFVHAHREHLLLFVLPLITAGITTFYMFRMWFLTFTGQPRDEHVYRHAHESPAVMTVPLVALAVLSFGVGWGWPVWDPDASWLDKQLHHSQPASVIADFGYMPDTGEDWEGGPVKDYARSERHLAHEYSLVIGLVVMGAAALGLLFALLIYWFGALDSAETEEQFPGVISFLQHKWYFDEFYSVAVVRPALVVGQWCKWFDKTVIDGFIHSLAWFTLRVSKWDGLFDRYVVDGLVNLTAWVFYRTGAALKNVQTGYLRNYVLFLVLAAVGIYLVLSYFAAMATAG